MVNRHLINSAVNGDVVSVAGFAIQAINVLSNQVFVGKPVVDFIGSVIAIGRESSVIPAQKLDGVALIHRPCCHFLRRVVPTPDSPETIGSTKGRNATFGTDTGTGDV